MNAASHETIELIRTVATKNGLWVQTELVETLPTFKESRSLRSKSVSSLTSNSRQTGREGNLNFTRFYWSEAQSMTFIRRCS
jgi:hypothetical protein